MLLKEESVIVLSLLKNHEDTFVVDEISKIIEETSASLHKPVYDLALSFFKENGRFPDFAFFVKNFPDMSFSSEYSGEYSSDIIVQFLTDLRKEVAKTKAQELILEEDFIKASEVCNSVVTLSRDIEVYNSEDAIREYDNLKNKPSGIFSGIGQIDDIINGYSFGYLNVIAAPPACFKTTFAQNIAYHAIFSGFRVAFLSLELMKRNVYNNMLSRHSAYLGKPIPAEHMHKQLLEKYDEYDKFVEVAEDFKKRGFDDKFFIVSPDDLTVWEPPYITRLLEDIDNKVGGLDVVFLDYIQICRGFATYSKQADSTTFVNNIITHMSLLSKTFKKRGLIVFLLSQVNREGMKEMMKNDGSKGMGLPSLAEFSSLEREASTVTFLFANDADKNARILKAKVAKNRHGRTHEDPENIIIDPTTGVIGQYKFSNAIDIDKFASGFSSDDVFSDHYEEDEDDDFFA